MLNKIILMGRVTADPQLKTTQSGASVCTFTVAVERKFKDSDGNRVTDFINCVAWRQTAEFISKWFTKGRMIAVEGHIQTRSYTDRDGKSRIAVEVYVDDASFTGEPKAEKNEGPDKYRIVNPEAQPGTFIELDEDEELPF